MTHSMQNGGKLDIGEADKQDSSLYGPQTPQKGRVENLTAMGKGRAKGQVNRLTKTMKMAIEEAFEKAGGVEYLVGLAHGTASDRQAFLALVGRLLPLQINSDIDHKIRIEAPWLMQRAIGKVEVTDTESLALVGKSRAQPDIADGEVIEPADRRLIGDSDHV